jgi:hypothetical protein
VQQALLVVREVCVKLGPARGIDETQEAGATRSWMIYLGVLTNEMAQSACVTAYAGQARATLVLYRSVFEYSVRARYFLRHPDEALKAYVAIPQHFAFATNNLSGSADVKLREPAAQIAKHWKALYPEISHKSDRLKFGDLLRDVEPRDFNHQYTGDYGIASAFLHGQAMGMLDVFANSDDPSKSSHDVGVTMSRMVRPIDQFLLEILKRYGEGVVNERAVLSNVHAFAQLMRSIPDNGLNSSDDLL